MKKRVQVYLLFFNPKVFNQGISKWMQKVVPSTAWFLLHLVGSERYKNKGAMEEREISDKREGCELDRIRPRRWKLES
jgi:hypothetical protein